MSNEIYSCGFRLENFTGWGGTGDPSYASVVSSDTTETNKLGYVIPSSTAQSINSNILGCLWTNFKNNVDGTDTSVTDFFFAWEEVSINSSIQNQELVQLIFHGVDSSSNPKYLYITKLNSASSYTTTINFYVDSDFSMTNSIGSSSNLDGSTKTIRINYVQVTGTGTSDGTVTFWTQKSGDYTSLTKVGTYSVDLSDLVSFNAASYHRTMTSTNSNNYLYYMIASNFTLLRMNFSYELTSGLGSQYNQWSGSITSFSTYPVSYTNLSSGLYAGASGKKETFAFASIASTQGYLPIAVVISSALNAGTEVTSPVISDIVYSAGDHTTITRDVTTSGSGITWSYTVDPITQDRWTVDNINAYQFGINRVS